MLVANAAAFVALLVAYPMVGTRVVRRRRRPDRAHWSVAYLRRRRRGN
jgi:hypothetical protein